MQARRDTEPYVTFVADAAINELSALATAGWRTSVVDWPLGVLCWQVPKGSTLDSTISQERWVNAKSSTTTLARAWLVLRWCYANPPGSGSRTRSPGAAS